jgi:hypothetical protein
MGLPLLIIPSSILSNNLLKVITIIFLKKNLTTLDIAGDNHILFIFKILQNFVRSCQWRSSSTSDEI